MKTFLHTVKRVRSRYPMLWDHHGKRNRRIMVKYWLFDIFYPYDDPRPGDQLYIWSV